MELKEFIKATITAIAQSVDELNAELEGKAIVNPKGVQTLGNAVESDRLLNVIEYHSDSMKPKWCTLIQEVEFNLAITEAKTNEKGGGIRIEVISAGINSKKEIENINTVKFSIPITLLK